MGEKDDRTVVRCDACQLVRTLNPPPNYQALYTDGTDYHEGRRGYYAGEANYKERFSHDYHVAEQRFSRWLSNLRLLDVGCANGGFVAMAYDKGLSVEGIELNPVMADWTKRITHCVIHRAWDSVMGQFDIITYHDVIEHVPSPLHELEHAKRKLLPGGWLVLDTPDTDDPRFAELGLHWHHMKPVEHLWFFNEAALRRLLAQAGLKVRAVERPLQGKIVVYAQHVLDA